jgi:hypothetical protein
MIAVSPESRSSEMRAFACRERGSRRLISQISPISQMGPIL